MADVSWLVTPISLMNSARQGTISIEDSLCAEITRLLGLDQLLVEGHALVLLTKEPLIEVLGNGILQIVVDVVTQTEEVVVLVTASCTKVHTFYKNEPIESIKGFARHEMNIEEPCLHNIKPDTIHDTTIMGHSMMKRPL